jgi:alanine racemase
MVAVGVGDGVAETVATDVSLVSGAGGFGELEPPQLARSPATATATIAAAHRPLHVRGTHSMLERRQPPRQRVAFPWSFPGVPMTQAAVAKPVPVPPAAPPAPAQLLDAVTQHLNAWIEVDAAALESNARLLQRLVAPADLIAVVKANAYGAGAIPVAKLLESAGVSRFAVAWTSEALELRAAGIAASIMVLGHSTPADLDAAVRDDITLTIDSLPLGQALSAAASRHGKTVLVHIHLDTGLHRDGVSPEEAVPLADALRALPGIAVEGLSTHMANADETDDSFSDAQQARFGNVLDSLSWIPYCHTANSATALRRPEFRRQGVRIGLGLHGIAPDNSPGAGLRPILQLKARLARVFDIEAGEGASYGLTWRAGRRSTLGLVPIGYADGYRRALGNRGHVLVGGQPCPVVGRVCMDQFLIDITDVPGIQPGAEAVVLGQQGAARITASDLAADLGTIPWEVLSGLQARIPRIFHRDGNVVARA